MVILGHGPRARAPGPGPRAELRPGAVVRLRDLTAASHLNGSVGFCEARDDKSGCWRVCLSPGAHMIRIEIE